MAPAPLSTGFQSFTPLPTITLGPSPPLLLVWMNIYFLFPWCRTSLLFNFLSVLVVRGGAVCLPTPPSWFSFFRFFKKDFYYFIFRQRGRERGEKERNISVWLPLMCPPLGNLACHPDMCPDRESNQRPFGLQTSTQSTELHQPGLEYFLIYFFVVIFKIFTRCFY